MICDFQRTDLGWKCSACGRVSRASRQPVAACGNHSETPNSCPHLGPLLRTADGAACGCTQVPIHECRLHGGETALRMCREGRTLWKGRDCLTCRAEGENAAFTLMRQPEQAVGAGYHRAGWPCAVAALAKFSGPEAPLALEDFVEKRFAYDRISEPIRQPWCGVFHHPPHIPHWTGAASNGWGRLVRLPAFRESLPCLRGAVCLSAHLAQWLAPQLKVPTIVASLPTAVDVPRWRPESLEEPNVAQVGWYLRNTRAAFQVAWPAGWKVQRYLNNGWAQWHDELCRLEFTVRQGRREVSAVPTIREHLPNVIYDEMLADTVVFTEIAAASANCVVVECMARATPLLVNRLAPVIEYLGRDYPLFYDSLAEVPRLLERSRLMAAHEYLLARPVDHLRPERFARQVADFCLEVGSCG